MNKFFGIILFAFGILMVLAFIGQLTDFLSNLISLFKIFSSELSGEQRGYIIGQTIYWIIHFTLIYFSFKYGRILFYKNKASS